MTEDKVEKGKKLLIALKFKKQQKCSILDQYTPPKCDEYYEQVKKIGPSSN